MASPTHSGIRRGAADVDQGRSREATHVLPRTDFAALRQQCQTKRPTPSISQTEFIKYLASEAASLRLDTGGLDYFGPLLGFGSNVLAEIRGWATERCGTEVGKPRLHPGIGQGLIVADSCACAASDHAAAIPPNRLMNSRLLIRSPRRCGRAATRARRGRAPCGLEIDDQFIFGRLLHRQIGRVGIFENFVDVGRRAAMKIVEVCPITHETARLHINLEPEY